MKTLITALGQHDNAGITVAALPTAGQRSKEYRAKAAECQQIADRWPDPLKSEYGTLARQWRTLAEQTALRERHQTRRAGG